jgi:hypothetical protein
MMIRIADSLGLVLCLLVTLGLFSGCVTSQQVYVTQIEAAGAVALPPVVPTMGLSTTGAIAVIPHFAVNSDQKITGRVDPVGVTPQWGGTSNLIWRIPRSEGGMDLQVSVSPSVAILLGGAIGGVDGSTRGNFRAGVGLWTVKDNMAIRLDGGVQLVSVRSRVRTTVVTQVNSIFGNAEYRSNFDDIRDESSFSPYVALTLNTASETSPVNVLLNFGVAGQPLFDLYPSQPDLILGPGDATSSIGKIRETVPVYSLTPAVCVQLGGGHQLLLGGRMIGNFSIDQSSPDLFWQPFVQFVLHF